MRNADVMQQLRAARPAQLATNDSAPVWRAIVAAPGDPRLLSSDARQWRADPLREIRITGGRRLAAIAAVGLLVFGGAATAGVLGIEALLPTVSAPRLFRADPQIWNQDNHNHPPPDGLIQRTVLKAETLRVPGVGNIQYWVAHTRGGGSCEAFKLPDGAWAGTTASENVKYNFGGIVPGCHQPNRDGDLAEGGGFDFDTDSFGPSPNSDPHAASDFTFVVFGTVDVKGAVRVRDMQTGHTVPVVDRDFFAIERPARQWRDWRFQALDSSGKVLSTSWAQKQILKTAQHHRRH